MTLEYLERVQAQCPSNSVVVFACGIKMYELVEIYYGALLVREVEHLTLNQSEPFELTNRNITGYWFLEK